MANDLVRWGRGDDGEQDGDEGWDLPPTDDRAPGASQPRKEHGAAKNADRDADAARRRGDGGFAVHRETDAAEHRQSAWDWGDARTWLILFGLCFVFLLMSAAVYFLPFGRHNQNDGPSPTPEIRVY